MSGSSNVVDSMKELHDSELSALTVTYTGGPGARSVLCLALVMDFSNDRTGYYDLGGYGFICRSAHDTYGSLEYVLPLQRAVAQGHSSGPLEVLRPEQGWVDVGLTMDRSVPPPAPLLFDVSAVPSGIWWIHTMSAATRVEIWRAGEDRDAANP